MAVHLGQITPVTGTTVTVTGIPFQPVGVMFFGVHSALTNISQTFGAASGSSEQFAMWTGIRQQTSGYLERHSELRNDACIYLYSLTNHATLQSKGVLSAFTSDGFSVAFTGAGGTAQPIFYMAVGGKNVSAAQAGTLTLGASTGVTSTSGLGFDPVALVVAHTTNGAFNTQEGAMSWGIGYTDGSNQYADFAYGVQGSVTAGSHMYRTDSVACAKTATDTYRATGALVADGFDINVVDAWTYGMKHGYLAIDCATAVVGSAEFADTTGVVSYATPGLKPGGVLFSWNGADTPSTAGATTMPVRPGVGALDGVTVVGTKSPHGAISGLHRASAPFGSYQPLQSWRQTGAVHIRGAGSQVDADSTTLFSEGAVNALAMDSFELNWTTATTNSRIFGWLALPGEILAPWIPQIYRRVSEASSASLRVTAATATAGFVLLDAGGDQLLLDDPDGFLIL